MLWVVASGWCATKHAVAREAARDESWESTGGRDKDGVHTKVDPQKLSSTSFAHLCTAGLCIVATIVSSCEVLKTKCWTPRDLENTGNSPSRRAGYDRKLYSLYNFPRANSAEVLTLPSGAPCLTLAVF